jgi:bifunctional DNase/RNase
MDNIQAIIDASDGSKYKEGRVEGFPRQRLLAYDLLFRCLKTAVGHRNP